MTTKQTSRSETAIINLATSALAWGWPVLLALVTTPMIVRGLGNDLYGVRALVLSIAGYFALLDMGLNGSVTKYLAEYHAKNDKHLIKELLGTTLTTYTIMGLIGGVIIWVLAEWFTTRIFSIPPGFYEQAIWAFRLTGVGFFLSMITWWGSSIPTGIQRFDVFNGISIGFGTITTAGTVAAVYFGYGLIGVITANLIANSLAIVAYLVAVHKLMPGIVIRFSFEREMFKRTVLFGIYMLGFRLFSLFFAQLDSLMIAAWIGTAAITFYTVPMQLAQVIHGINAKMMQIIFPMASEFSATGEREKLERMFYRGFNLSVFLGMVIALPLAVAGEPILRYWISPDMANNATIVFELLIATFFWAGLTAIMTSFLSGVNLPQLVMYGSFVSGVAGVLLYALFIHYWGINGAALGKLLSVMFTMAYYFYVCKRMSGISLLTLTKQAIRPMVIGIVIGVVSFLTVTPLIGSLIDAILVVVIVSAIYAVACWIFHVFNYEEKQGLINVLARAFTPIKHIWINKWL